MLYRTDLQIHMKAIVVKIRLMLSNEYIKGRVIG